MKTTAGIANEGLGINALDQQAVTEGTAQAVVGIMMALAALVGLWGVASLVGGIMQMGLTELAAGFVAAVTGN